MNISQLQSQVHYNRILITVFHQCIDELKDKRKEYLEIEDYLMVRATTKQINSVRNTLARLVKTQCAVKKSLNGSYAHERLNKELRKFTPNLNGADCIPQPHNNWGKAVCTLVEGNGETSE